MNFLSRIVFIAVLCYAGACLFLYLYQSKLLYLPNIPGREVVDTPKAIGLAYETVMLKTEDDVQLHAWFIPADVRKATLLYCHGNAGNIGHRLHTIEIFHQLGLDVLIFDYQGYGQSEGSPSEQGTYMDAMSAWRYLTLTRRIPAQEIVVFGRSLGAAIAAWLASNTKAGAIIVESGFTSIPDIAAEIYPIFPVKLLARLEYPTQEFVKTIHMPILIVHSKHDELIPYAHGVHNYQAANDPKHFLELRGDHNTGFIDSARTYINGLKEFIQLHVQEDTVSQHVY